MTHSNGSRDACNRSNTPATATAGVQISVSAAASITTSGVSVSPPMSR